MSCNETTKKPKVTDKYRNFATIVYPESAPENWRDILIDSHIPAFVSELHDKDINPDGTPKKPHYHVMTMYDGPKTQKQAKKFFESLGGVGCEIVDSLRGYARYLKHLDNPEKYQYQGDIDCYGGANYIQVIGTAADKAKALREIMVWINENDIISFSELCDYAAVNRSDWFDTLINSGSYFTEKYIKSRTWTLHKELHTNV